MTSAGVSGSIISTWEERGGGEGRDENGEGGRRKEEGGRRREERKKKERNKKGKEGMGRGKTREDGGEEGHVVLVGPTFY